jgi:predicted nucleic acid-binding protein
VAGYLSSGRLTVHEAEAVLQKAAGCLIAGEHMVSDDAVLALVARSRCTAYDCEYVALAAALNTVLVTEDRALLAAFPKLCRSLDQMLA